MAGPPEDTKRTFWSRLWYDISDCYQYKKETEVTSHVRETLLVVAALIIAVTFQAVVNPPGGVWQDDEKYPNGTLVPNGHKAGGAVYASKNDDKAGSAVNARKNDPFYVFLAFNTLALSTSILLLISLTIRFRYRFEVLVATLSMFATYASAIFAIAPAGPDDDFRFLLFVAAAPVIVRALVWIFFKS